MSGGSERPDAKIDIINSTEMIFGSGQKLYFEVEKVVMECCQSEADNNRCKNTIDKVSYHVRLYMNGTISSNFSLDNENIRKIIGRWFQRQLRYVPWYDQEVGDGSYNTIIGNRECKCTGCLTTGKQMNFMDIYVYKIIPTKSFRLP